MNFVNFLISFPCCRQPNKNVMVISGRTPETSCVNSVDTRKNVFENEGNQVLI